MTIGIDIGGTNTDGAVVGKEIRTFKVPNEIGVKGILRLISRYVDLKNEKIVVSTSVPLNVVLTKESPTLTILFPGPGLNYESYGFVLRGAVNHRGDLIEDVDEEELEKILNKNRNKFSNVAIASKFSIRNPSIELKAFRVAKKFFDEKDIALSYFISELNYPLRITTTVINAKIKRSVHEITYKEVLEVLKPYKCKLFFYKGDGGIIPYEVALNNPSLLYNSSQASLAVGAYFLTREKNALVVDIGGTTTDFVEIRDGRPKIVEGVKIGDKKTLIRCVDSYSIPFGGDSLIDKDLKPFRLDKPIAFKGKFFTLTDALNCTGFEIGNYRASREKGREIFGDLSFLEQIVDSYVERVVSCIRSFKPSKVILAGYLARYMKQLISKRIGVKCILPMHSEAVNAIGVAVSRISLTMYVRFDTEKGIAVYNGKIEKFEKGIIDDDLLVKIAKDRIRSEASKYDVSDKDLENIEILYFNSYTIVRHGMPRGKIADVILQIKPGISHDFL